MRYRALTAEGDYRFGEGPVEFLVNSPATVAQAVLTRLQLWETEWFLDITEGLPTSQILGAHTQNTRDLAVKAYVLDTPGVLQIVDYASTVVNRVFTVSMVLDTIYGTTDAVTFGVN